MNNFESLFGLPYFSDKEAFKKFLQNAPPFFYYLINHSGNDVRANFEKYIEDPAFKRKIELIILDLEGTLYQEESLTYKNSKDLNLLIYLIKDIDEKSY